MARRRLVTDPDDPALAPFRHLRDPELRRSIEARDGLFVVEGVLAIRRAITSPYPLRRVLVTEARAAELGDDLDPLDLDVLVAPRAVLAATVGFDLHRGAVAVAARVAPWTLDEVVAGAQALVVLEGVNDAENLGAIGRTAAGLGADALVLDPTCADPLYRRSVRVSMGELLHLPIVRAAPWPAALGELRRAGVEVVALTPDPHATDIDLVPKATSPRALLLGAEGPGLSAAARDRSDHQVRIPLHRGVDSLNVGHALAIALHVLTRRR